MTARSASARLLLAASWLCVAGVADAQETSMLGGDASRNMASPAMGLPASPDPNGTTLLWKAELGTEAYAGPVVAGGKVFVGTNNGKPRNPAVEGDKGVLMAFDAEDGSFLWQATHDKLPTGRANDWPEQGVCSTPAVVGDRVYYVSNRGELISLDADGFRDGENDGPVQDEARRGETDADVVWRLDLVAELGVFPHFMSSSSPLVAGDRLFVMTGNGPDDRGELPAPEAPSFVAVDRRSGEVLWQDASPGKGILDGQWSSPAYGRVDGVAQVAFTGGDGRIYAFDPATGKRLWSFDANQPIALAEGEEVPGAERRKESFIAAPVYAGGLLYAGVGRDPEKGSAPGRLWALDPSRIEDGTPAIAWVAHGSDFGRTLSTVAVSDGRLYAADLAGFLYAFDAASGKPLWKYDTFAAIWGSPFVADGRIYLGDEDGDLAVLQAGGEEKLLNEPNLGDAIYTTPAAENGVLYVATRGALFAFRDAPPGESAPD